MKKNLYRSFTVIFLLIATCNVFSQKVSLDDASLVATEFLKYRSAEQKILHVEPFSENDNLLAWVANLNPVGFILISPTKQQLPITAYSFESNWDFEGSEKEQFHTLMRADLNTRIQYPETSPEFISKCKSEWSTYLSNSHKGTPLAKSKNRFEQWPPEGSTPTGGWVCYNWKQGAPYNQMCPMDQNTHSRSLAGCPTVAMSMILNCILELNETRLDDSDDYYHSFGAGNQFWIDDDWLGHGFPYFDSLNVYLDSIEAHFANEVPLSDLEAAALIFAGGTALKQVYSSSISGTYGIEQARDAFQRFGFTESRLVYDSDTTLSGDLAENMKIGCPAQLGLIDPPHTVGHNVVVDGYNSDKFFHLNFGWGGSSNGWYTMPPTTAPYNLTVIEGVVMDIFGNNPHVGISKPIAEKEVQIKIDQLSQQAIISGFRESSSNVRIKLYNINGQLMKHQMINVVAAGDEIRFSLPKAPRAYLSYWWKTTMEYMPLKKSFYNLVCKYNSL